MKEKQKFRFTNCGVMLIIFCIIAYVINFVMPTSSSWAYIYVVGPIFFLIGVVVLIIGIIVDAARKKKHA